MKDMSILEINKLTNTLAYNNLALLYYLHEFMVTIKTQIKRN